MSLSAKSRNPFNAEIAKACVTIKEKRRIVSKITVKDLSEVSGLDYSNLSKLLSESNFFNRTYFCRASEDTVVRILATLHVNWEQSLKIARTMGYDYSDMRLLKNEILKTALSCDSVDEINKHLKSLGIQPIVNYFNK